MDDQSETALHFAARAGHVNVAELLIRNGADVNALVNVRWFSWTPVHEAAVQGHAAVVSLLLRNGVYVDLTDLQKHTALHCAAKGGAVDVAELLLQRGAGVNAVDKNGWTPLHHAAVAAVLARAGAAADDGQTPLLIAANRGKESVVQLLLDNGANACAGDDGWTVIDAVAAAGHGAIAKTLLGSGVGAALDIAASLKVAARNQKISVVHVLVLHGAGL